MMNTNLGKEIRHLATMGAVVYAVLILALSTRMTWQYIFTPIPLFSIAGITVAAGVIDALYRRKKGLYGILPTEISHHEVKQHIRSYKRR